MDIRGQIAQLIRPLQVRVANSIARAVVQLVDDGTKLQLVQLGVLAGEDIDDAERFQGYGFSSVPLPGAEAVVLFPNGDRAHPLVVAVDDRRYRPIDGEVGDVVVYNAAGATVRLKADGDIVLTPASGRQVQLGGDGLGATDGLVHGTGIDSFTGATYASLGSTCASVRGKKT